MADSTNIWNNRKYWYFAIHITEMYICQQKWQQKKKKKFVKESISHSGSPIFSIVTIDISSAQSLYLQRETKKRFFTEEPIFEGDSLLKNRISTSHNIKLVPESINNIDILNVNNRNTKSYSIINNIKRSIFCQICYWKVSLPAERTKRRTHYWKTEIQNLTLFAWCPIFWMLIIGISLHWPSAP